jgi:outer membrane protein OmpA-like peptidoglycan-associated protein
MLSANLSAVGQLKDAIREMQLFNYSGAIKLLQKAVTDKDQAKQEQAILLLAECYRKQNDIPMTLKWYRKTLDLKDNNVSRFYYYAQALRSTGDYKEARRWFLKFDSLSPGDPSGRIYAAFCDSAILWKEKAPRSEVINAILLNSPQSEFGVIRDGDGILFASDRYSYIQKGQTYTWTGNSYLNLYFSNLQRSDSSGYTYTPPLPFEFPVVRSGHEGPVAICKTCGVFFITTTFTSHDKGRKDPGKVRTHLLKIFTTRRINGSWSPLQPFFLNSDEYSVGHPALNPGMDTLYFVSDMPGGNGGTDIYLCTRKDSIWGNPVNLGRGINTQGNEMFPYAGPGDTLYFASDGHCGFGGLDIFSSRKVNGVWAKPENQGIPINSSYDDFSFFPDQGDSSGWFSSNRPGGKGGDDIWFYRSFRKPELLAVATVPKKVDSVLPSLPEHLAFNRSYLLENIYYDFDKWNIRQDAVASLDSLVHLMQAFPITVEIGSHTDCRGSDLYNQLLSQRRAESVVQYLTGKGIPPSRITFRGYGKSQLINICNCSQPDPCTEQQHQENRRTEFRIIGYYP